MDVFDRLNVLMSTISVRSVGPNVHIDEVEVDVKTSTFPVKNKIILMI